LDECEKGQEVGMASLSSRNERDVQKEGEKESVVGGGGGHLKEKIDE
jgi:hypothetical protein